MPKFIAEGTRVSCAYASRIFLVCFSHAFLTGPVEVFFGDVAEPEYIRVMLGTGKE